MFTDEANLASSIPTEATVSACYERFKQKYGDKYTELLRAWYSVRQLNGSSDLTVTQRTREFKKYTENVDNLIRSASARLGFEAIFLAVGGIVNQDQNLSYSGGSEAAKEFFPERYRSTDRTAIGHLRAHVFDRLSKKLVAEGEDLRDTQQDFPTVERPMPTLPTIKIEPGSNAESDKVLAQLRELVIEKAAEFGIDVMKRGSLAWKKLPEILSKAGIIIVNWPEDVPYPCDEKFKKGISSMRQDERVALLAGFEHATYPVTFKKKYSLAVPKDCPVIIGAPPPPNSSHARGHRKFLDKRETEDRKGLLRLKPSDSIGDSSPLKPASTSGSKNAADQPEVFFDDADGLEDSPEPVKAITRKQAKSRKRPASDSEDRVGHETEIISDDDVVSMAFGHSVKERHIPKKRQRFAESEGGTVYSSDCEGDGDGTDDNDLPLSQRSPHQLRSHGPPRLSTDRKRKRGRSTVSQKRLTKDDGERAGKTTKDTVNTQSITSKPNSKLARRGGSALSNATTVKKPASAGNMSTLCVRDDVRKPAPEPTPQNARVVEDFFGGGDMAETAQTPSAKRQKIDDKGKQRALPPSLSPIQPTLPPPRPTALPASPPRSPTPKSRRDDTSHPIQYAPWQGGYYAPPMNSYPAYLHGLNAHPGPAGASSSWQPIAPAPSWYRPPMDPNGNTSAGMPVYPNGFWGGPVHYPGSYEYLIQNGHPQPAKGNDAKPVEAEDKQEGK